MADHIITVVPPRRGQEAAYRWKCSCGRVGKHGYGFAGLAEQAGRSHAKWKTDRERAA